MDCDDKDENKAKNHPFKHLKRFAFRNRSAAWAGRCMLKGRNAISNIVGSSQTGGNRSPYKNAVVVTYMSTRVLSWFATDIVPVMQQIQERKFRRWLQESYML